MRTSFCQTRCGSLYDWSPERYLYTGFKTGFYGAWLIGVSLRIWTLVNALVYHVSVMKVQGSLVVCLCKQNSGKQGLLAPNCLRGCVIFPTTIMCSLFDSVILERFRYIGRRIFSRDFVIFSPTTTHPLACFNSLCTVRKMGLILRSIERMLKMESILYGP